MWVAMLCALAAFVESFVLGGVIFPIVVASRSMTPALMGPVRAWTCTSCGQGFVCSLDSLPEPPLGVHCPHCKAAVELEAGRDRPGQRVFVDAAATFFRPISRWEAIVYRDREDPSRRCVKRVVGLPGETVEIAGGQVLVDGHVAKKNLEQLRQVAVGVHGPAIDEQSWDRGETHYWRVASGHAQFSVPVADDTSPVEWLIYQHRHNENVSKATSILDESPLDQAESRLLNPVHDLLLVCQARVRGPGQLCLRVATGHGDFVAILAPQLGTGRLTRDGTTMGDFVVPSAAFARQTRVELAIVDGRAMLSIAGDMIFAADFDSQTDTSGTPAPQLAVGARNVEVDISELSVLRDIFYTPAPNGRPAKVKLGPGEYYVLGDNSPHAIDTRSGLSPIKKGQILGIARWW